jgi:hypothetical protein
MVTYVETEEERNRYRIVFRDGLLYDYHGQLADTKDFCSGKLHGEEDDRNPHGQG